MKCIMYSLLIGLECLSVARAGEPQTGGKYPPVPEWGNLGSVDIVPCPKRIRIGETRLPLANLSVRYLQDDDERLKTGAEEIKERITSLGGSAPKIAQSGEAFSKPLKKTRDSYVNRLLSAVGIWFSDSFAKGSDAEEIITGLTGPTVIIGYGKGNLPFKDIPSIYQGVNVWDEAQGYVIAVKKMEGSDVIVVWGTDATGALYGCLTLTRLIGANQKDGVYVREADIIDWPDFKWRKTSGIEAAQGLIAGKRSVEAVKQMKYAIRHAAEIKCNIVDVAFWRPGDGEYLTEDEVSAMKQIRDYARAYGVRLGFFHAVSLAKKALAEKDPRYRDIPCIRGKYMSWSNDELIDESLQRLKAQVEIFKGQADYGFHMPDINEGGWAARSESDRKRWGDDRAAGDAYFANKTYQAIKEIDPGAKVEFVFYPYLGNLDYPGNAKAKKYFSDRSKDLPADLMVASREGSMEAFQSWRKCIKQPLGIWWSPNTFWGARAFAPDMAFLKTAYSGNRKDMVADCLTAGIRPVLIPSQYSFSEYAWNVNAPGSGIWRHDPSVDQTKSTSGVPVDYVGERRLHENGELFTRWIDGEGRGKPKEMMYDLLERICRMVYGEKAAPAMAEALRNSCPTDRGGWSDDPEIAGAQYTAAKKAFETLIPLWDKKEYFSGQYELYRELTKTYADLHVLMRCNYAAAEIKSLLGKAGASEENRVKYAGQAAVACEKSIALVEQDKKYLKDLYDRYGLEGIPWAMLLQPRYGKYADILPLLSRYEQEFQQGLEQARFLIAPPKRERFASVPYYDKILAAGGRTPENLIRNSSFEELNQQGMPAGWSVQSLELAMDKDPLESRKAVKLMLNPDQKWGDITASMFEVVPGTEYYVEFWAKKDAGFRVIPMIVFSSGERSKRKEMNATSFPGYPKSFEAVPDYTMFYGVVKAPEEKNFSKGYVRFYMDWEMRERTGAKNLFLYGVKVYHLNAESQFIRDVPILFELIDPEISDRTVQDGTDTFIKSRIRIKSPVTLTNLKVECIRVTADGHRRNPLRLKGTPGFMEKDKAWESSELEFTVGPTEPETHELHLVFKISAKECEFEIEKTLK